MVRQHLSSCLAPEYRRRGVARPLVTAMSNALLTAELKDSRPW